MADLWRHLILRRLQSGSDPGQVAGKFREQETVAALGRRDQQPGEKRRPPMLGEDGRSWQQTAVWSRSRLIFSSQTAAVFILGFEWRPLVSTLTVGVLAAILLPHAEHFVAERTWDARLAATLVQRHVDQLLVPSAAPAPGHARPPRMHQDVFAEVLGGQAEVEEGGAKAQGVGQLQEGEVVVMVI